MAIPFNWPSEEDTEEYYRRLDQLLADLYDVLRHILLRPRAQVNHPQPADDARDNQNVDDQRAEPPEPPGGDGDDGGGGHNDEDGGNLGENSLEQRLRPLPDLVASTEQASQNNSTYPTSQRPRSPQPPSSNSHRHISRRHRSRRRSSSPRNKTCCALKFSHSLKTSSENWIFVGQELRKIAEEFRTSYIKEEKVNSKLVEERQVEVKASSLLSLLVPPAPFSSSIWTTVILLVGWKLIMRCR